jgi:hypothetical protein
MADSIMKSLGAMFARQPAKPAQPQGVPGFNLVGGYLESPERGRDLSSHESRYRAYSEMLANTSIVAAGTRYFLNLVAGATWSFTPADTPDGERMAELAEAILTDDPATSWARIVRRAAMYRFYGFSLQEWTAVRHADGHYTLKDVQPRAQSTIKRWDVEEDGTVVGVGQESPQTRRELYIPRAKLLYLVDDTLSDSPEGLGLFRHLAAPAKRLDGYLELEGTGFETDLRGVPVGRGPFKELEDKVNSGQMTKAEAMRLSKPLRDFLKGHVRSEKLAISLDSATYETKDEAVRPSGVRQWDVELLNGGSTSFAEVAAAVERTNREMARVLGVEQLLLGGDGGGAYALGKDKTSSFFLLVDGALREIREQVVDDLLKTVWRLNGWDFASLPTVDTEAVRHTDVAEAAAVLRDMATAGAVLSPEDPAINELRDALGLSHAVPVEMDDASSEEDASLGSGRRGKGKEGDEADAEDLDDETPGE